MEKTKFPKHSHSSMAFMNQLVNYPPHHNYSGAYSQDNLSHSFVKKIWRKGKWTEEEENYAEKIVLAFNAGILDLPTGTTLRSALSELLNCDPMRITKKFSGSCIGKQPYIKRVDQSPPTLVKLKEELERAKVEFNSMVERNLELQQSNLLFTSYSPYSQNLSRFLPIIAESGENYHAMLHQHALASLQVPANMYQHSFTGPSDSNPHDSLIPTQNISPLCTTSFPDPSGENVREKESEQQQQEQDDILDSNAELPFHDCWDNEWGIPNLYEPGASPRLTMLYYSSTPYTPHTTNQPYIYLPPRYSYPIDFPKYTSSLTSDDLLATSTYPKSNSDDIHAYDTEKAPTNSTTTKNTLNGRKRKII